MKSIVSINERIKDLRVEKGLNLNELSQQTGIPASTLSDYEQEDFTVPHLIVIKLAEYFGVTSDYLLGMDDIKEPSNNELSGTHLTNKALEVLRSNKINSRLVSEIIENEHFPALMMDAEVYVDGFVEDRLEQNNRLFDIAREKVAEKTGDDPDTTLATLNHIHYAQEDYFAGVLSKDFILILKDLNDAHRGSPETSDRSYTSEAMSKIIDAVNNTPGNGVKKLAAIINALLGIGLNKKNIDKTEELITKGTQSEADLEDLLARSETVEPDVRKRRRKKKNI